MGPAFTPVLNPRVWNPRVRAGRFDDSSGVGRFGGRNSTEPGHRDAFGSPRSLLRLRKPAATTLPQEGCGRL